MKIRINTVKLFHLTKSIQVQLVSCGRAHCPPEKRPYHCRKPLHDDMYLLFNYTSKYGTWQKTFCINNKIQYFTAECCPYLTLLPLACLSTGHLLMLSTHTHTQLYSGENETQWIMCTCRKGPFGKGHLLALVGLIYSAST